MELLRKYKITYRIYNFFKKRQLSHNIPLYQKYGLRKRYYSSISSKDFEGIKGELNVHDRLNAREELPKQPEFNELPPSWQESLKGWSDNGYAILDGFFDSGRVDAFNEEVDKLIKTGDANWRYMNKIMFAIHKSDLLNEAANDSQMLRILKLLMGKDVEVFQSINFLTGSKQRTHSDSIHMTTFPLGNLIAIWVALEDIRPGSGELHYYPGSHKLPYVMNADYDNVGTAAKLGDKTYVDYEDKIESIIDEKKLRKQVFLAKKGDVLIWHANLLHGGEPNVDEGLTRKSMVFHYYANDAICYHEVTQRPALKRIKS